MGVATSPGPVCVRASKEPARLKCLVQHEAKWTFSFFFQLEHHWNSDSFQQFNHFTFLRTKGHVAKTQTEMPGNTCSIFCVLKEEEKCEHRKKTTNNQVKFEACQKEQNAEIFANTLLFVCCQWCNSLPNVDNAKHIVHLTSLA